MTAETVQSTTRASVINLANLLQRDTPNRLTIVSTAMPELDPELYVVTRTEWRHPREPLLQQLPRLLSNLEALRGTRGVPTEVYLDSSDGIALYLPTGVYVSDIPMDPKSAVLFLKEIIRNTIAFYESTVKDVEEHFWRFAKREGFSKAIVEKIGRKEPGFRSRATSTRFHSLMRQYFSIKFRIHTSEWCLRVEGPA